MRRGVIISGVGHGALILVAVFGLPERQIESAALPQTVSDVSFISLEEFQAAQSTAPLDPSTIAAALAAPDEDSLDPPAATTDISPDSRMTEAPEAPTSDAAPDTSGLQVTNPDVAVDLDIPMADMDAGAVGLDSPLMNAAPRDGSINSTQTALLAPSRPNLAPRIDTKAAPKPPEDAKEDDAAKEATIAAPSPEPTPEQPEAEKPATAPKEATTERAPDAKAEERPTTPTAAARPRGRPNRVAKPIETRTAEPAAKSDPKPDPETASEPAQKPAAKPAPAAATARLGQDFNSGEARAIGDAIGTYWNKAPLVGKQGFEKLVIIVRVRLNADGSIIGGVEPVEPADPQGDYRVAFRQARTAVLRAAAKGLPLPQDKFKDGDYLEIRFDPGRDAIALE